MILNEDYFDDLEIKDEDIIEDDINDVGEPEHRLTLEEAKELPKQYEHCIQFQIANDCENPDTTKLFQTTLIPKLFKRLDAIFELYGIEHSEYILTSAYYVKDCNTVVKFGNYQLFCAEYKKDDRYSYFYIYVYVNYSMFSYKRAFRFVYTVLNLYKYCKQITWMRFEAFTTDLLQFGHFINHIHFNYYNLRTGQSETNIFLDIELTEKDKREIYKYIFRHFFGDSVNVPYDAIERDVPIKPLRF